MLLSVPFCTHWIITVIHNKASQKRFRCLLRLADVRREAMRFLLRAELDTCLLVSRLWTSDVHKMDRSSNKLALRTLTKLLFKYVSYS